jgi:hypothetical protein
MQEGARWRVLVKRVQRLWPGSRQATRTQRVRLTLQTCRRCRSRSYLRIGGDRLCGGCHSLH